MNGYGFHWSRCPGGDGGGYLLLGAALVAGEVILQVIWEIVAVTAACAALSVAAVLLIGRATRIREARYEASEQHQRLIGATVTPQVTAPAVQVVEHHHYVHAIPAPGQASAIVRAAITGEPGDAITEGGTPWHSPR